jgi:hypothetical protein
MRIKKTSQTTPIQAQVIDGYSTSTTDSYSCNYANTIISSGGVLNSYSNSTTQAYSANYINNLGKEPYSTNEQVIGTWIDGKPLYRRVLTTYSTQEDTNYKYLTFITDNTIKIVNSYGRIFEYRNNNNINYGIPTGNFGLGEISSVYQNNAGLLYLTIDKTHVFSNIVSLYIIIEYTKTTD